MVRVQNGSKRKRYTVKMQIRKSKWIKFKKESEENEINEKKQIKEKFTANQILHQDLVLLFRYVWYLPTRMWFSPDVIGAMLVHRTKRKRSFGNLTLLLWQTWARFVLNPHRRSAILFLFNFFRSLGWNLARPKTLYLRGNEQPSDGCAAGEEIRQLDVRWLWNWTAHALDFWSQTDNITERDWRSAMGNADW